MLDKALARDDSTFALYASKRTVKKEIKRISRGVFYSAFALWAAGQRGKTVKLDFSKFSEICDIIIPFFTKHSVIGMKSSDFKDFKKVAEIIKNNKHKTREGYDEIVKINSSMNDRRL